MADINEVKTLARQLMLEHNLTDWSLVFINSDRTFGKCVYKTKQIQLSMPAMLVNPIHEVQDTILHEIAHALTPRAGHGKRWKDKCVEIGARPLRCVDTTKANTPNSIRLRKNATKVLTIKPTSDTV